MKIQSSYDFLSPALTTMGPSCSTNVMRLGVPNNTSMGFGMLSKHNDSHYVVE